MAKTKIAKKPKQGSISLLGSHWSEMDKAFDSFRKDFERSFLSFPSFSIPSFPKMPEAACDVVDEGKQFQVKVDILGIKKNEIKLNVTDNSIEVSGEHKEETQEKKKNYLRKERSQVSHFRTIPLSEKVVSGQTKAKLADGVLTITLPKSKPTPIPKKKSISVQ